METKDKALKIFLDSDVKYNGIAMKINELLDKEMVYQNLNIPLPEGLNVEIDEAFKELGRCQRQKYESEISIGLHKQIPNLN